MQMRFCGKSCENAPYQRKSRPATRERYIGTSCVEHVQCAFMAFMAHTGELLANRASLNDRENKVQHHDNSRLLDITTYSSSESSYSSSSPSSSSSSCSPLAILSCFSFCLCRYSRRCSLASSRVRISSLVLRDSEVILPSQYP